MEWLTNALPWIQIVISVLLIATILMQKSEAGLGSVFGGSDEGGVHHTRRGSELFLFRTSIVLAALYTLAILASVIL